MKILKNNKQSKYTPSAHNGSDLTSFIPKLPTCRGRQERCEKCSATDQRRRRDECLNKQCHTGDRDRWEARRDSWGEDKVESHAGMAAKWIGTERKPAERAEVIRRRNPTTNSATQEIRTEENPAEIADVKTRWNPTHGWAQSGSGLRGIPQRETRWQGEEIPPTNSATQGIGTEKKPVERGEAWKVMESYANSATQRIRTDEKPAERPKASTRSGPRKPTHWGSGPRKPASGVTSGEDDGIRRTKRTHEASRRWGHRSLEDVSEGEGEPLTHEEMKRDSQIFTEKISGNWSEEEGERGTKREERESFLPR